ncbi:hypothetical protein IAT38_002791 [Cryptococcus sp. DSM 104549]
MDNGSAIKVDDAGRLFRQLEHWEWRAGVFDEVNESPGASPRYFVRPDLLFHITVQARLGSCKRWDNVIYEDSCTRDPETGGFNLS